MKKKKQTKTHLHFIPLVDSETKERAAILQLDAHSANAMVQLKYYVSHPSIWNFTIYNMMSILTAHRPYRGIDVKFYHEFILNMKLYIKTRTSFCYNLNKHIIKWVEIKQRVKKNYEIIIF